MKKVPILLLLVFEVFYGYSQEKYTLKQCIDLANINSPLATQIPLIEQNATLQKKILNAGYLPQSSLGGTATWQSEVTSLPINIPGMSVPTPPQDQYKATIDVVQNIWDGGLTSGQKNMAQSLAKVESQKVAVDLYQIKDQVSALFFGILLSEKLLENTQLVMDELAGKIEKVKASVQNGVAMKSSLLQLEAKFLDLKQQNTEAQLRKKSAVEALSILTGKSISVNDQFFSEENISLSSNEIRRPELVWFDNQSELQNINSNLVRSKNLPKISLFGTGGYGKPGLNFLASDFKTYFIGGVQLKVPLSYLYAGSQKNEIEQFSVNRKKIESQKQAFLLASNVKLANQKAELERLSSILETDKKLVEIRSEIKKTADAQLTNGVISASDYITEVNNEILARQTLAIHQVQYLQAKVNLKVITGEDF
ncbi:MAG: TolC family protein [Cytophagaceae bacterium]|nr:TolC family protein [Cytophagaceae bacterium]